MGPVVNDGKVILDRIYERVRNRSLVRYNVRTCSLTAVMFWMKVFPLSLQDFEKEKYAHFNMKEIISNNVIKNSIFGQKKAKF